LANAMLGGMRYKDPAAKLAAKTDRTGDCWVWTGFIMPNGYGQASAEGKHVYAHRYSYEHYVGPISEGLVIDHLCRNRACVRPDHLEVVSTQVNNARGAGAWALTGMCNKGLHDVTDPTTWAGNGAGKYTCKACRKETRDQRGRA